MTQIMCDQHGMQSPCFVSPRLANKFSEKDGLTGFPFVYLTLHLPFGKKGVFPVDQQFLDEFEIGDEVLDEELSFDIYGELKPVCSVCFDSAVSEEK